MRVRFHGRFLGYSERHAQNGRTYRNATLFSGGDSLQVSVFDEDASLLQAVQTLQELSEIEAELDVRRYANGGTGISLVAFKVVKAAA